jgi:hypothetical protein
MTRCIPGATSATICPSGSYSNSTGDNQTKWLEYVVVSNDLPFKLRDSLVLRSMQAPPDASGHPALLDRTEKNLVRDLSTINQTRISPP